jgi:hypothetical protein
MTVEYRSPDFHGAFGREFLVAVALTILVLALARRRMTWPHLIALLGTTAFALHSMRNIPLWGLTALPLVAMHADSAWRTTVIKPLASMQTAFTAGAELARAGFWTGTSTIAVVLLGLVGGRLAGIQLLPAHFDPGILPVRLVERARADHVSGRMFNELAWGGYILNAWPEQRVFIDGQTDFYGESLSQLYVSLLAAEPGWKSRLDSLGVRIALLPRDAPLAEALRHTATWSQVDSADGAVRFETP